VKKEKNIVLRFFSRMTKFVYHAIAVSPVGRLFGAYDASNAILEGSVVGRVGKNKRAGLFGHHRLRRTVACVMEENVLLRLWRRLTVGISTCSLRTVGVFLLAYGIFSASAFWLDDPVFHITLASWMHPMMGLCACLLGVIALCSDRSVGHLVKKGIFGAFLSVAFGMGDDAQTEWEERGKNRYALAVLFGLLSGVIGLFVYPLALLIIIDGVLLLGLILSVPESGVLLLLFFTPLTGLLPYGTVLLSILLGVSLAGYLGKLIRGNRVFRLDAQDIPVLLLILLFVFSSFSVADGAVKTAFFRVFLLLFYLLVVNTIATERWFLRCRAVMTVSGVLASVIGILQFVMAVIASPAKTDLDVARFGSAVKAGFADHIALAYFLVISFAFTFPAIWYVKKRTRPILVISCGLIAGAIALTWVQSAWLALAVMIGIFLLIFEHRSFPFLLFGGVGATGAFFLLSGNIRTRITDLLRAVADAAVARRAAMTHAASAILFGSSESAFGNAAGVRGFLFGVGTGGFAKLFPLYAAQDAAFIPCACNFFVYLMTELGIVGLLVYAMLLFLVLQNCYSALRVAEEHHRPIFSFIGITMVAGVLLLNFFSYSFYDPAAFLMFFAGLALVGAGLRHERRHQNSKSAMMTQNESSAELSYRGRFVAKSKKGGTV